MHICFSQVLETIGCARFVLDWGLIFRVSLSLGAEANTVRRCTWVVTTLEYP